MTKHYNHMPTVVDCARGGRNMRCLVTGASGFLGSWLIRALAAQDAEILALVRDSSNLWRLAECEPQPNFIRGALSNITSLSRQINDFRPEVVFHLAWTGGNSYKYINDIEQIYSNVPGSLELIRIAKESGARAFIYLGSAVEYGTYSVPVRETDATLPHNLYGVAKNATMLITKALCEQMGMRFCGVRVFWAYGPMDDPMRMIPSVTLQLLRGERPRITPGEQLWDFLYITDAIAALTALGYSESAEGIFNLGSGSPCSIRDVVSAIRDLVNPACEIGFGEIPYRPDQIMHLEADISRLASATGWRPKVSLQEGLQLTVNHYRQ